MRMIGEVDGLWRPGSEDVEFDAFVKDEEEREHFEHEGE